MRINEPFRPLGDDDKPRLNKNKRIAGRKESKSVGRDVVNNLNFMKELDNAAEEQLKMSLDQLVEEINGQAKQLAHHRTFEELDKYKKMVKSFMDQAIKKIYTIRISDSSKLMIKRKKVYIIVDMVDRELEKLTKMLLESQSDSLDILAALDRIRGMLVDMYS
jgi:uncharacterized protein YaaR (DUF327 family)